MKELYEQFKHLVNRPWQKWMEKETQPLVEFLKGRISVDGRDGGQALSAWINFEVHYLAYYD